MDYCNVVYNGLPAVQLRRLQMVFNTAARFIYGERRSCHIKPLLENLHWLKVGDRIQYKILLTVFRALNGTSPSCISELCVPDLAVRRPLRSTARSRNLLVEPSRAGKTNFFERAFRVAGPVGWNRLPKEIRCAETVNQFKRQLKAALFARSFSRP